MNPLLLPFETPFETPPFHLIKEAHYLPAIQEAIRKGKSEIEKIKEEALPNFDNTIVALDRSGARLNVISAIFFNINSAETNPEIQALAREISPILTAHSNDILLDDELFQRIQQVYEARDQYALDAEQKTLLDKTYKGFVRNGAKLSPKQKERLREIDRELSQLALKFGENVLAETNKYELVIDEETKLEGLPPAIVESAAQTAEEKGKIGKWIFTLAFPSYIPFMTYATNRALRRELFHAYNTRACKGDDLDNQSLIKEMVTLKQERSQMLGYRTYADFVLEERMAKSPSHVSSFLLDLLNKAKPKAQLEVKELADFARELDGQESLEKWDFAYYSEKLKKRKFDIDDEQLRPYFKLEQVIEGVFATVEKLFSISFIKNDNIPKYHPDVTTYEVNDSNGQHLSVLFADFFPRSGKRNGAWMTSFRGQRIIDGKDQRPHISIVCNFTKPTKSKPSLLTFNEVKTLFHEFGHALHGILAKGNYESLSGTSVFWDFVELPSQIFENWCYEKECLDIFAKHYESGDPIPEDLIDKLKAAVNFQQGYQTLRQISFGLLDIAYHEHPASEITDIPTFESESMKSTQLLPEAPGTLMSTSFSHIFQGGYAAGYYSYKWAEVLDADAFELFQEKGVFNQDVAQSFHQNILAAGGSEHPEVLFRRFRGRAPKPDALLKRAGLI